MLPKISTAEKEAMNWIQIYFVTIPMVTIRYELEFVIIPFLL